MRSASVSERLKTEKISRNLLLTGYTISGNELNNDVTVFFFFFV